MGNVDTTIENRWASEDNVLFAYEVVLLHPFECSSLKPYQIDEALTVGKVGYQMALATLALFLETKDFPLDLYKRHIGRQLMDVVESRAVYMLVWKIVQEILERRDAEFRFQQFGSLWAYAGQISDGSGEVDRMLKILLELL